METFEQRFMLEGWHESIVWDGLWEISQLEESYSFESQKIEYASSVKHLGYIHKEKEHEKEKNSLSNLYSHGIYNNKRDNTNTYPTLKSLH